MSHRFLDDGLLEKFIHRFYGYGNYAAPFWFIGMEEGGGKTPDEVAKRIEAWEGRGMRELEDVVDYSRAIGNGDWFEERPRLQTTWSKLIRILLAAQKKDVSTEIIRAYQRSQWARDQGEPWETCVVELLPLPSPSSTDWLYSECSKLPFLLNRETYRNHMLSGRITHLKGRIEKHRPKVVVFYGRAYRPHWENIAGAFGVDPNSGVLVARNAATLFVSLPHPAARLGNHYFDNVGRQISSMIPGTAERIATI